MKNLRKAGKTLFFLAFTFLFLSSQGQEIQMVTDPESKEFGKVMVYLSMDKNQDFSSLLKVYVGKEIPENKPAVLGSYSLEQSQVVFTPRFPPVPGKSYTVVFNGRTKTIRTFDIPEVAYPPTRVERIDPAMDSLPSNLLRLYIHFNQPMSFENPYQRVSILDQDLKPVAEPFVEVSEGLWNGNRTRLTLFIHPGRIKRGVGPNVKMGPVLEENRNYTLLVDPDWKDANGQVLGKKYEKSFHVVSPVREKLEIRNFENHVAPGSTSSLILTFSASIDKALLGRMIKVLNSDGEMTEGNWDLQNRTTLFTPISNWKTDSYTLVINYKLEDISGNTFSYIFDSELENGGMTKEGKDIKIDFQID